MNSSILIGISGGIAAYKVADLCSQLRKQEWDITVAMTPAAETFITPKTFHALTDHPVLTQQTADRSDADEVYSHLFPAVSVDVFLLAPATANSIAKITYGFADDPVCSAALALKPTCRKIFAPAMNTQMWNQSIVSQNCATLRKRDWTQVGPDKGQLACGMQGDGRLADLSEIISSIME
jgi:phosphopantothenoylcysteine synthetase/decarboxylase